MRGSCTQPDSAFTGETTAGVRLGYCAGSGHSEGRLEEKLMHFGKPTLLVIDELGYLPFEPNAAHLLSNSSAADTSAARQEVGCLGVAVGVVSTAILCRPSASTSCSPVL